ncbi:MAG: hypothetical protein NT076_02285 [Candidatus Pacearchaeota archaeon]|nr:hypothetical protein [Candidatus Pacearchaeota archaeon]
MTLDRKKIKEQAKKLLDNFAAALGDIKTEEVYVQRKEDRRQETEASNPDADFKKRMLENAPNKDKDCVIAEKGSWIE